MTSFIKPQKQMIRIEVSLLEAAMIIKLRKYDYGDFEIVKIKGDPSRVIFKGSEILKESEGMVLALDKIL